MSNRFLVSCFLLLASVSAAHAGATASAQLKIIAINYPLAYFAERIGGNRVSVKLPVPADEDPAFWRPSAHDVADMQKAELIVLNGADYEKWLPRVSLSKFKLADTSAAFKDSYIRIDNAVTHNHGPGGMHSHDGTANTTWLDFKQAGQQADAVAQAMIRKRPELQAIFLGNLKNLQADLAGLDSELSALAARHPKLPLFASHPVYQYFARRYALNLQSVHWEPNEMPPAAEWTAFDGLRGQHAAHWMIWEGEPDSAIRAKLHAIGVESLVFSPCANRPVSGDFLSVMRQNLANLRLALP